MASEGRSQEGGHEEVPADGRAQRSVRSRERILDALIALVEEGHLQPTGQEVADRAGMNLRTVFRHFDDMEALNAAIRERVERTIAPTLVEAPPEGSLDERITAFARRRARVFERITAFQRAERLQRWHSKVLAGSHARLVRELRRDLSAWLPEVDGLEPSLQRAIELASSWEAWDRLRDEQALSVKAASEALEALLRSLLEVRAR